MNRLAEIVEGLNDARRDERLVAERVQNLLHSPIYTKIGGQEVEIGQLKDLMKAYWPTWYILHARQYE